MDIKTGYLTQRYLFHTRRYATLAGAIVAVAVLLLLVVVIPQVQSIFTNATKLQQANKTAAELNQKVDQLRNLPQSVLLQASDEINSVLPSKKPLLELLTSYSEIAREAGVQFSDVSISPGRIATESASTTPAATSGRAQRVAPTRRASTDYDQLDLSMKVSGDLDSINLFLQRIEQIAPITTVTSMSLTERLLRSQDQSQESVFEAELVTTSYFFTQPVASTIRGNLPAITTGQQEIIQQIQTFFIPEINEQTIITGGGLQDLFGVSTSQLLEN